MRQRHQKFENTPYALEPNCKEARAACATCRPCSGWRAPPASASAGTSSRKNGLATPFEVQQIKRNEALLQLIRARLHVIAGRREDRLVFDLQTAVAASFGYVGESQRKRAAKR